MKLLKSALYLSSLASLTTATPTAEPVAALNVTERAGIRIRGGDWASCTLSNCFGKDPNGNAQVNVDTWGDWDDDWGHGFLDNLRAQCGGIYGWTFWYDDNDTKLGGHAQFWAYQGRVCDTNAGCPGGTGICSGHCVENAFWLASGGVGGMECGLSF